MVADRHFGERVAEKKSREAALAAGAAWARDPANSVDLERLAGAINAMDLRGPEDLHLALFAGLFAEEELLYAAAARDNPRPTTGAPDEAERYMTNFASGAMGVWCESQRGVAR